MAPPEFDYTLTQQLFCLNVASNAVGTKAGKEQDLQQIMKEVLLKAIPSLQSDWELVWGPTVYKKNKTRTDTGPVNAWYVVKSEEAKTYVVSIAGTAMRSPLAWFEDVNIRKVVDFDDWTSQWKIGSIPEPASLKTDKDSPKPLVSAGTSFSSHNVLSIPSPANGYASDSLLGDFLSQKTAGYNVIFTGHSMGGAVAPTVALGLTKAGFLKNATSVSVLASAGATPGNAAFAAAFEQTFKPNTPSNIDYVNTDYCNSYDIVPQAFNTDLSDDRYFSKILEIYNDKIVCRFALKTVNFLYNAVKNKIDHSIPYATLPGTKFEPAGGFGPCPGDEFPTSNDMVLLRSIGYQHMGEYWIQLRITGFVDYYEDLLKKRGLHDVEPEVGQDGIEISATGESEAA